MVPDNDSSQRNMETDSVAGQKRTHNTLVHSYKIEESTSKVRMAFGDECLQACMDL